MDVSFSSGSDTSQNLATNGEESLECLDISFSAENSDSECEELDLSEMEEKARHRKQMLEDRLKSLQNMMLTLKNQLADERELWRKEVEETIKISNLSEHVGEILEVDEVSDSINNDSEIFGDRDSIKEFTISEYEEKLARYQEALAHAEAEKRATLRRQAAISNYKRRLLEVENMCNLELLRVKQSVQFLQPLQMIASEWNLNKQEKMNTDEEITGGKEELEQKKLEEVKPRELVPVASFGHKLFNDMNEMFSKISTQVYNIGTPKLSSSSSSWQADDEIGVGQTQSAVWYSSKFLFPPDFNSVI